MRMKKIFTYEKGFVAFCIVVAVLFALGAVAVSNGSFSVIRAGAVSFLSVGALLYLFLAFCFARPKPPTVA